MLDQPAHCGTTVILAASARTAAADKSWEFYIIHLQAICMPAVTTEAHAVDALSIHSFML